MKQALIGNAIGQANASAIGLGIQMPWSTARNITLSTHKRKYYFTTESIQSLKTTSGCH